MRLNATQAARLVGVSDKTMGAWFREGKITGAKKVSKLGRPEEWEIEIETLFEATAEIIDPEHLRMMAT